MIHTYGDQGIAYPVEPEQVWRVGGHYYVCSDLMYTRRFRIFLDAQSPVSPSVVYCDPPWGQALANGFRTKAGLEHARYDWTDIYREVADLAEEYEVPLYVECSEASTNIGMKVPGVITRREGHTARGYWNVNYFGDNPAGLYYAWHSPPPIFYLENNHGFAVTEKVLAQYAPGVVMDPCSGLGGVPLVAERLGWGSLNNELSPYRVSKALSRMSKQTGIEPERIR